MSRYRPKQFSPRIYPEWGELISDLSPEKAQEIFMAICQYPNRNPDVGVWRFIKSQIDRDYAEFVEKAARNKEVIKNYWANKGERTLSDVKQPLSDDERTLTNDKQTLTDDEKKERKETKNSPLNPQEKNKINKNIPLTPEGVIPPRGQSRRKISFSDVFDWESLFDYWESRKKGGRYKTAESRGRMLARLKELTGNDFELAKKAICHCVDSGYQGFCNGNELFYKPANDPPKPPETSAEEESKKRLELINKIFGEDD